MQQEVPDSHWPSGTSCLTEGGGIVSSVGRVTIFNATV